MTNEEISLRDHFDYRCDSLYQLFEARWKAHDEVHAMGQRALDSAFDAAQAKLHELNQIRQQAMEDRAEFLRRDIYDRERKAMEVKVDTHGKWIDNMNGKLWSLGALLMLLNVFVGLLLRFWPK